VTLVSVALTLGLGDHLVAITLRGLEDALGLAARLRNNAIGVGFGLVLQALLVGTRRLDVAEGVDHLRRRIDLLQLHLGHLDAGAVAVEDLLHQLLHVGFGLGARFGQDRLDRFVRRSRVSRSAWPSPYLGFWMLKRKSGASAMRQNTTKSTSTMFVPGNHQFPRTSRIVLDASRTSDEPRMPISMR
jgi:hypothetical protein